MFPAQNTKVKPDILFPCFTRCMLTLFTNRVVTFSIARLVLVNHHVR